MEGTLISQSRNRENLLSQSRRDKSIYVNSINRSIYQTATRGVSVMPLYAVRDATDKALLGVASAPDLGSLYRRLSEVDNPYALEAKIISETYGSAFFDDDKKALKFVGAWFHQFV